MTPKCCFSKSRIFILRLTLRNLAVVKVVRKVEGGEQHQEIWWVKTGFRPSAGAQNQVGGELAGVEGALLIVCWRKVAEA